MNQILGLVLLLVSFCNWTIAQEQNVAKEMLTASNSINFIKQNGIFIRLRTYDKTIAHYKEKGAQQAINSLQQSEENLNKEILEAFKNFFSFCPVYYFYSRDIDELRNGNFNKVYTLSGEPIEYAEKNFFVIDPYYAYVRSMNHTSTGFSALTKEGDLIGAPFPSTIIKRFGPFYKTYEQLVFDWNYRFEEMLFIRSEMATGILKDKITDPNNRYSTADERELNRLQNNLRKRFKKGYDWDKRPKRTNTGR